MSRLEPSSTPVCLSFNMAAVEFRGLAHPSAGSPCETSREIAPPCAGYGWQSGRDSNASLTAQAYRDDVWISQETGALLREKLLMASRRLPKLCVAVFNVDMDSPALSCRGAGDEAFPRVSELARSAGYAQRGPQPTQSSLDSDKNMKDYGGGAPKQTNLCGGGDGGVEKRVEAASHNAQRTAAATQRGGAWAYHVTSGGSAGANYEIV
ncbi:hypothetical protein ISCGN_012953 [Ixodes scapularis]